MRRTGRVNDVAEALRGSDLIVDAALGAAVLELEHVGYFDDLGGQARLRNVETDATEGVTYVRLEDDAGKLHLGAGTLAAWPAATTRVDVLPLENSRVAAVLVDDAENEQDVIDAHVPITLYDRLPLGARDSDEERESVIIETEGLWLHQILDILGQEPAVDGSHIDPTTLPPPNVSDGLPPSASPAAIVTPGIGSLFVRWTPLANADPVTYDLHISTSSGFTPSPATKAGEETGGSLAVLRTDAAGAALVAGTTYFVRIVARDFDGQAAAGAQGSGAIIVISSDGVPPASSPTPTLVGYLGVLFARWAAVANVDLVTYEVHISTSTGFTPSPATKVGETAGLGYAIRTDAAGTPLVYGTTYFVKLIARDSDGSAAASAEASGATTQVAAGDIVADTITAGQIAANAIGTTELAALAVTAAKIAADTITSNEIAANAITAGEIAANAVTAGKLEAVLVLATLIKSVGAAGRIELDSSGLRAYSAPSGGTLLVEIKSADGSALITGRWRNAVSGTRWEVLSASGLNELLGYVTGADAPGGLKVQAGAPTGVPSGADYYYITLSPPRETVVTGTPEIHIVAGPEAAGYKDIRFDTNDVTLETGSQARGYVSHRAFNYGAAARDHGVGTSYGAVSTLMNVPSSITLTTVGTDANVSAVGATEIHLRGFRFEFTVGAGLSGKATRTYVTVGN